MELQYIFDLIGTCAFAISGVLAAENKKLDWFGATFIGFITAVGGGSVRDVLLGSHPLGWVNDVNYLYSIGLGVIISLLFTKKVSELRKTLFLFDTIGIGLFTIIGLEKTLALGHSSVVAVIMGVFSAAFGGVIRDILVNDIPLIFRKTEIYATACAAGGLIYLGLDYLGLERDIIAIATISFIIVIRTLAVKYHITLPELKK